MLKLNLNENFICRIWENNSNYKDLKTTDDENIEIIDYGIKNYDSGPDYKNAKVKINNVTYTGSIEIHRSLKDWYQHSHKGDDKYNDLILHVVFYRDEFNDELKNPVVKKARNIPTVILSEYLNSSVHEIWKEIINTPSVNFKLPCFPQIREAPLLIKAEQITKLSMERICYKSDRINFRLKELTSDLSKKIFWDRILFEFTCEALGYSKNKEQFIKLAQLTDLNELKQLRLSRFELDAVLFGLSGFLHDLRFKENYIYELKAHWIVLQEKLKKERMDKSEWNFFRLRPANFPPLRIAYASALLYDILNYDFLKDVVKIFEESENVKVQLELLFKTVEVSEYWKRHYDFGKGSNTHKYIIGQDRIMNIVANVLIPLVYLYSSIFNKENLRHRIEYFYKSNKQKKGSNEVIRVMENQMDLKIRTLAEEQGLIHLHHFYCMRGKCSECDIGQMIFKNENYVNEPLKIILY